MGTRRGRRSKQRPPVHPCEPASTAEWEASGALAPRESAEGRAETSYDLHIKRWRGPLRVVPTAIGLGWDHRPCLVCAKPLGTVALCVVPL